MTDAIASLITLLEPSASFTKLVVGAGSWSLRREEVGRPFCCAVLEGSFGLAVPAAESITLRAGDFALLPFARNFQTFSLDRSPSDRRTTIPVCIEPGVYRLGDGQGEIETRHLIGYGAFGSGDAGLIASLLPPIVHVRGDARLTTLLQLIDEETGSARPARAVVLTRLLELLLIEALRSTAAPDAPPGLLRGLADQRLACALRVMHAYPGEPWSVARLAQEAGLSRSVFFDRFGRAVGMAPMEYLLHWRMLSAKRLLRERSVSEVAQRTGYSSGSTFSTAFSKYAGRSPRAYRRQERLREPDRNDAADADRL